MANNHPKYAVENCVGSQREILRVPSGSPREVAPTSWTALKVAMWKTLSPKISFKTSQVPFILVRLINIIKLDFAPVYLTSDSCLAMILGIVCRLNSNSISISISWWDKPWSQHQGPCAVLQYFWRPQWGSESPRKASSRRWLGGRFDQTLGRSLSSRQKYQASVLNEYIIMWVVPF